MIFLGFIYLKVLLSLKVISGSLGGFRGIAGLSLDGCQRIGGIPLLCIKRIKMEAGSGDLYLTLGGASEGVFKDRGSRFIAYAHPVSTAEESMSILQDIKKEHFKARHHCFAYEIGHDGNNFRMSDDGEPSGTAGKPILGQIRHYNLRNTLVVVVRYFGGVKLGTSGLINAYRESTRQALEQAEIVEKQLSDYVELQFGYEQMPAVMQALKGLNIEIYSKEFTDRGKIVTVLPHSEKEALLRLLKSKIAGVAVEQITDTYKMDNILFTELYTL